MNHDLRKGSALIILLCVLVVAVIAAAATVWCFAKNHTNSVGTCCDIPASYPSSSIQAVSSAPTSTASSTSATAAWKTYTNSTHDFSFQYPNSLFINGDSGSSSVILSQNAASVLASEYDLAASFDENPNNLSIQKYFSDDTNDNGANLYAGATISTTTVDALPATIFNGSTLYNMTSNEVIVVPYQGGFLEIVNNNLDENTFNAILRSFNLAANISNWQTYTNQQYGFSVKYPTNWMLKNIASASSSGLIALASPSTTQDFAQNPSEWPVGDLLVSIDQNPGNLSMQDYYNGNNEPGLFDPNYPPMSVASTSIGGMLAYEIVPGGPDIGPVLEIVIPQNGFFVRIEEVETVFNAGAPIFNQILSTFQFVK